MLKDFCKIAANLRKNLRSVRFCGTGLHRKRQYSKIYVCDRNAKAVKEAWL